MLAIIFVTRAAIIVVTRAVIIVYDDHDTCTVIVTTVASIITSITTTTAAVHSRRAQPPSPFQHTTTTITVAAPTFWLSCVRRQAVQALFASAERHPFTTAGVEVRSACSRLLCRCGRCQRRLQAIRRESITISQPSRARIW